MIRAILFAAIVAVIALTSAGAAQAQTNSSAGNAIRRMNIEARVARARYAISVTELWRRNLCHPSVHSLYCSPGLRAELRWEQRQRAWARREMLRNR